MLPFSIWKTWTQQPPLAPVLLPAHLLFVFISPFSPRCESVVLVNGLSGLVLKNATCVSWCACWRRYWSISSVPHSFFWETEARRGRGTAILPFAFSLGSSSLTSPLLSSVLKYVFVVKFWESIGCNYKPIRFSEYGPLTLSLGNVI